MRPRSRGTRLAVLLGLRDTGRVLRDFATYLPTQAIPAIAGFLVLPVLARKLFPTELGVLTIAQTLITLGWTIVGSWLAASIIRELPAHRARGDVRSFARTLGHALGLVALALAVFAGLLSVGAVLSGAIAHNLALIVAATGGLVVQNIAVSLFAASLRPRAYAMVEVSARVGGIGLGVGLVFAGYGVTGYLAGLAGSSITIGLIGLRAAWPRNGRPMAAVEPAELRPWLRYGVPASMAAIVVWMLVFIDRYLLALLKDAKAVGIYTMGNALGDRMVMVPMFAFAAAATPLLVTAFEKQGREEVERLMRAYTRVILLVALPCIAYVTAVAGPLVTLIAGFRYADYAPAATVAPIVAVGSLLYALAGLANTGLAVAKRTKMLVLSSSIGLAVNVAANLVLIPWLGIKGAAIATPLANAVYLLVTYRLARPHATWHFPYPTLVRGTLAAAAGFGVVAAIPFGSRLAHVGLSAVIGGAVYVLALGLLGERRALARPRRSIAPS